VRWVDRGRRVSAGSWALPNEGCEAWPGSAVEDDYHYPLPAGLRSGDVVRLVAVDRGYWTVEKDGQRFRVFMCCVQSGFEYEIGGRWVSSDDWRVKALRPRA